DARHKSQMFATQRAAEPPGDKQIVAFFSASARDPTILFHKPGDADRNGGRSTRCAGFATDNGDIEARGRTFQPAIKFLDPRCRSCRGNDEGDKRELRNGGDRGEIAEWSHHRFPANALRVGRWLEMNF